MSLEDLAINGGPKAKRTPFPDWPMYDDQEIAAVTRVVESRQWWRMAGTEVLQFEQEFAAYQGAGRALGVTNGTQALETLLLALGIGRGDEVIIPAFTFISTASAVLSVNAVPVLVDVDPVTYCMDPATIEAAITPRTRAIMPVHMAGHVADMDAIVQVAERHGLLVIEDAAHANGAEWRGRRVGALQDGGIFSFQAFKLMSAGEGGLILTNDAALHERCFLFASCGRPPTDRTYQHVVLGTNARLAEFQAAVLRVQLTRLDAQIERREANARLLDRLIGETPGLTPQGRDARVTRHPHYMYMFRYDAEAFGGLPRQQLVDMLIAEGVPAFVAYASIHRTPLFRERAFSPRWRADDPLLPDYSAVSCPAAEKISDEVVWLHHRVLLGEEQDVVELVDALTKIQQHATRSLVGR